MSAAILLSASGCGQNGQSTADNTSSKSAQSSDVLEFDESKTARNELVNAYADKEYGFQTELPEAGEEVAVLHTSMGDIYIRLFPEAAPKAVENFKTHIKEGYYDGLIFHRVWEDFMIQGGDPTGTGTSGESIWGEPFEDEFCEKLLNIRGSLAMANSGIDTNGSQFFINQAKDNIKRKDYDYDSMVSAYTDYFKQAYEQYGSAILEQYPNATEFVLQSLTPNPKFVPDEVWDLYEKLGGNIHLDGAWRATGGHTVFGQVYKGMDIVDAIAAVEVDSNHKPLESVTIKSAEIVKYSK